jgi:hypothetical protein
VIDFRYFLITLVAVFLALGIGIVMGSGVLRDPILNNLEKRADSVVDRNGELRKEIDDLETDRSRAQTFFEVTEPVLVRGELLGEDVVLVRPEGTDGSLTDSVEQVVSEAGGEVLTRIVLSNRLDLEDDTDATDLAEILGSDETNPSALRSELGAELGNRLGAAGVQSPSSTRPSFTRAEAEDLLTALQDAGFVSIDRTDDEPLIPLIADLVVAAGHVDQAPYDVSTVLSPLARRAAAQGMQAAVTESSDSSWDVVAAMRDEPAVADQVSTIDDGETVFGRVALVVSLSGINGQVGHWGTDDGAEAIVPTPPP